MKFVCKIFISLIVYMIIHNNCYGQKIIEDYKKISLVNLYVAQGSYEEALTSVSLITNEDVFSAYDYLQIAKANLSIGDSSKAKYYLMKAAFRGYKLQWLKNKDDHIGLFNICDERYYQNTYNERLTKYTDIIIYSDLKSMFDLDQYLRNKWMNSGMKDSTRLNEFKKIDTLHAERILQILNTNGWQGHKNLLLEEYFFPLFLHISSSTFTSETFLKYKKILFEELVKGNLKPDVFALWVDRYCIWHLKQKAIYGVFWQNTRTGLELSEVENAIKIDSIRNSIGLLSLEKEIELKRLNGSKVIFPFWYKTSDQK